MNYPLQTVNERINIKLNEKDMFNAKSGKIIRYEDQIRKLNDEICDLRYACIKEVLHELNKNELRCYLRASIHPYIRKSMGSVSLNVKARNDIIKKKKFHEFKKLYDLDIKFEEVYDGTI